MKAAPPAAAAPGSAPGAGDRASGWLIAEYERTAAAVRKWGADPCSLTAAEGLRLRRVRGGGRKPRAARGPMTVRFGGPGGRPEMGARR